MAGYEVFSAFYDALTENVEYEAWAEYILALFERFSEKRPQTVLDFACGTGSLTERLLQRGLRVIGVDGSAEMLAAAQQKTAPFGKKALLLCQDMCDLELGGTVDGANDQRIVMAAAVAATAATAPVTVTGAEAVRKSYPSFWEEYKRLGGSFDVL